MAVKKQVKEREAKANSYSVIFKKILSAVVGGGTVEFHNRECGVAYNSIH